MSIEKMKRNYFKSRFVITVAVTIAVVAAIILANVFVIKLAEKKSTIVDLTTYKSNSLSPENLEFIKKVDYPVEIIVCTPNRSEYTGNKMVSYVYNVYYVQTDATPDNYFNQTINLLETYAKSNENITLKYVDPQKPEFEKLESEFDVTITYGDIIVRCERKNDKGELTYYNEVLTFEEVYNLYDPSNGASMTGYPTYIISSSNIESVLSSAIYTVAASNKSKIGFLTEHSKADSISDFANYLSGYNFEIVELKGTLTLEKLKEKEIETVMLSAPTSDLSDAEIKVLEDFLRNDGKKGRNFVVFGSAGAAKTPKLNEWLEEWGIVVTDKMVYETNGSYKLSDGTSIKLFDKKTDLTKELKEMESNFYCANNIALETKFEEKNTRTTHTLLTTSAYAIKAPMGEANYEPTGDEVKGEIPSIIVTEDTTYDNGYNDYITSYVGYFSSDDFISGSWLDYSGNGNMRYTTIIMNIINGRDGSNVYYDPKITGLHTMSNPLTETEYNIISICSIVVIPVLLLIGGAVVWFRRRHR